MRKTLAWLVTLALFCGLGTVTGSAFIVSDGFDTSYAAAIESMVLLKNEKNALPLTATDKIALFGEGQVVTNGRTGGFLVMGQGSGSFRYSGTFASPCDILISYAEAGKLGGVYAPLVASYKTASAAGGDFAYSPTAEEYAAAAAYADKAVYILNRVSHEGSDAAKALYELTAAEEAELAAITAAFGDKPIIVVLNNGLLMNCGFANGRVEGVRADALLAASYMGSRAAEALCDTLVGAVNPSGKTVDSYAKKLTDYPSYNGFYENNYFSHYYEDIYVGYRYFETFGVEVDYPFGYGLSYTTFDITDVTFSETATDVTVTAKVTNTGKVAGKEVVQVYFSAPQKGTGDAVLSKAAKELCGFVKTNLLAAGESETVTVTFPLTQMASYDDLGLTGHRSAYVLEAGDYTVHVGNSVQSTVVAGTHTEEALRIVEQLSALCEPTKAFERMTFDGTETVGITFENRNDLTPAATDVKRIYRREPIQMLDVLRGTATRADFLAQMSNDELCELTVSENALLVGSWGGSEAMGEKYGIARADTADGPQGIKPNTDCTGIPGAAALACTWNPALLADIGDMIGREAVISDADVWLSPAVNIHRFPLCGRNFEYFSEDPYLSGVMAAQIIRAVEANGVPVSVKHLVGNERENHRSTMDSRISERALREIYLRPFKACVEAGASTIMTSYNKLNGTETAEHTELLRGIVRGEWGFTGLFTTDWSNDSNLAKEVIAGNNIHSSANLDHLASRLKQLRAGVEKGTVSRSLLIENAAYILDLLLKTPAARRLAEPPVTVIAASGESKLEAEDYANKHNYPRYEVTDFGTVMSYTRVTDRYTPWLEYVLDVRAAGSYIVAVQMTNGASNLTGDSLRFFVNGKECTTTYQATNTGGWTAPAVRTVGRIDLPRGKVTLKIKCADGRNCGNLDFFTFTPMEELYTPIGTAAELLALMGDSAMWNGSYYLTADIDLTGLGGQAPIGTYATNFRGNFDGMGHAIRGVNLSSATERDFALFGKIAHAVIRDLTVYGEVTSTYAGAVVGGIVGTVDYGAIVANCVNYCDVTSANATKAGKGVGGVVGYVYSGGTKAISLVKDCDNYGTVRSESGGLSATVGGIAGALQNDGAGNSEVLRCINYGDVYGGGVSVGGIVGYMGQANATGNYNSIAYCANYGKVEGAKGRLGGIVGFTYSKSTVDGGANAVTSCVNYGALTAGTGNETGGIVGINGGANLKNCVNLGTVTAADAYAVSGIIGDNDAVITTVAYTVDGCYTTAYTPIAITTKAQYTVTDTRVATLDELITGGTTLDGYVYTGERFVHTAHCGAFAKGDCNTDGEITLADALLALRTLVDGKTPANPWLADIDEDGAHALKDVLLLLTILIA